MENINSFVEGIKSIQISQLIDILIAIIIFFIFRIFSKTLSYITEKSEK